MGSVSEVAPDLPAWSPLADPARIAEFDDGAEEPPGPPRRTGAILAVIAALLGIAAVTAAAVAGGAEEPPPAGIRVDPPVPATSFEDPAPLGSTVSLGNGWTVAVRGADLEATRALTPLNRADPLAKDERFVLISVELTHLDSTEDPTSAFYAVDLGVVGQDGRAVTTADPRCVASEPQLDMDQELPVGASARGRICFAVAADQVDSLQLVAEPSMTYGSTPSHLALG